jgi:hypothetical protein
MKTNLSGIALFTLSLVSAGIAAGENNSAPSPWTQAMTDIHAAAADSLNLKTAVDSAATLHPDECATFRNLTGLSLEAWSTNQNVDPVRRAIECLAAKLKDATPMLDRLKACTTDTEFLPLFDKTYHLLKREQLATLPKIAFVRRTEYGLKHTNATMFAHRTGRGSAVLVYDPATPDVPPKVIFETQAGFIWDISPSYDNRRLLMSYKENTDQPFHVWEIEIDGTGLRQLTSGNWHDFNPVYYPDGRIVFCSSRVESYSLCQDFLASALYIMQGDGSDIRRIDFTTLCTMKPAILPDGSILCTRWEYQDKNIFQWQGLWTLNPDGRQLRLYFGNTFTVPNSRYGGRPVPGTSQVLITMAAHHFPPVADIALVDRSYGIEAAQGMRKVTFETPYVITRGKDWQDRNWGPGDVFHPASVTDPCPLRDGAFLASFGRRNIAGTAANFVLCLAHYDGTRFELFPAPDASCFSATTLDDKPIPRAIPGHVPTTAGEGTFFVQDVYNGLAQQGVRRGQVKRLRIMAPIAKKWNTEGPRYHDHYPVVGLGSYYIKENLGEVPVDEDGAAYFRAPSNRELYFIALDADGKEIQRMGSVTQITTGEKVACAGCHEDRMRTPPPSTRKAQRLQRPPDAIQPPPWGAGPVDYVKQVQPVWDRYCVSCHSGRTPKADLDLSGDKSRFFNMSYDNLLRRKKVAFYYINPGPTGVFPALQTGSWVSPLTAMIEAKHQGVDLDAESRRRVYAWIDANVPYYGTWDMSRPHTVGGRDPWTRCEDNRRVTPRPEPWCATLGRAFETHCASCHDAKTWGSVVMNMGNQNESAIETWVNLTTPDHSHLLNYHLATAAGGMGHTGRVARLTPMILSSTNAPAYKDLLRALQEGRASLQAKPRMDMPGAVMVPQERDFGRVF